MRRWYLLGALVACAVFLATTVAAIAAGPGDVVISTPYPWVVSEKGKAITFSVQIDNRSTTDQALDLQIADAPASWSPLLKSSGFTSVKKVIVAPGKSQIVDLQATPPADEKANDYAFSVKALGPGGVLVSNLDLKVTLADKVGSGLKLSTQLPNLRGQAGTTFSFKGDAVNNATEDRTISFTAVAPQDWEVIFKPSYDTKQVSAVRVKAGETQSMDIDVTPPQKVDPGDYTVKIQANAGTDKAEVPFNITVLGNYKISISTPTGQLNARATVDQDSPVALVVNNNGASIVQNIALSASTPDGWQVTFDPSKIASLAPGQTQEVTAIVKAGSRALAGDYMVNMTASATQTTDSKLVRVTVETPTTWGYAGIIAIVIVLGGLGYMFAKLSRR